MVAVTRTGHVALWDAASLTPLPDGAAAAPATGAAVWASVLVPAMPAGPTRLAVLLAAADAPTESLLGPPVAVAAATAAPKPVPGRPQLALYELDGRGAAQLVWMAQVDAPVLSYGGAAPATGAKTPKRKGSKRAGAEEVSAALAFARPVQVSANAASGVLTILCTASTGGVTEKSPFLQSTDGLNMFSWCAFNRGIGRRHDIQRTRGGAARRHPRGVEPA